MTILTRHEFYFCLSVPAMERIVEQLQYTENWAAPLNVQTEVDNFKNLLRNTLQRLKPETENMDLIGE